LFDRIDYLLKTAGNLVAIGNFTALSANPGWNVFDYDNAIPQISGKGGNAVPQFTFAHKAGHFASSCRILKSSDHSAEFGNRCHTKSLQSGGTGGFPDEGFRRKSLRRSICLRSLSTPLLATSMVMVIISPLILVKHNPKYIGEKQDGRRAIKCRYIGPWCALSITK
jgi:hypothetical protein